MRLTGCKSIGRRPALEAGSCRFESCRPDHLEPTVSHGLVATSDRLGLVLNTAQVTELEYVSVLEADTERFVGSNPTLSTMTNPCDEVGNELNAGINFYNDKDILIALIKFTRLTMTQSKIDEIGKILGSVKVTFEPPHVSTCGVCDRWCAWCVIKG